MKKKKVLFISSAGGHLMELLQLEQLFKDYEYCIVTEKLKINSYLKDEHNTKVYFLIYGARNYFFIYLAKFFFNILKSFYIFIKFFPDVVITTGAHTSVPMCYISKLFCKKVIFIESFAKISSPTLSGKLVYPIADLFIVQWSGMLKIYPKAKYLEGGLF